MAVKYTFEELCRLSNKALMRVFDEGVTPDFDKIAGYEFKGFNTPAFTKLIGIQKFKKGFFHKDEKPFGYNIPVQQNGIHGRWICKESDDNPKRFGWYSVSLVDPAGIENKEPDSLLLNYADGDNSLFDGAILRDYLVQVYPDDPDILLGKAYLALGGARIFSNFFVLKRDRESDLK